MTSSPALFPAVTVTVVRDRKIRTALKTNQIAGFVTVPSWKKIMIFIFLFFHVVSQITYLYRALKINRTQAVNEFELGHIVVIQLHREL